jgi:hypothetical protein
MPCESRRIGGFSCGDFVSVDDRLNVAGLFDAAVSAAVGNGGRLFTVFTGQLRPVICKAFGYSQRLWLSRPRWVLCRYSRRR